MQGEEGGRLEERHAEAVGEGAQPGGGGGEAGGRKVRDLQRLLTPEDFEAFEAPEGVDIDSLSQSELYRLVLDQKKEREAIALAAEADARAAQELQEQQQADRLAYLKEFLSDEDIALARASIDAMGDNFGQEDEIALLERAAAIKNEAAERQHERQVAEYNEWAESYISASDRAKLEGLSGAARQSALDAAVKRRQATEAASAQRLAEAQAQQAADGFDSNEQTGNDLGGRETSDAAAWINFAKEAQERFPNADDPVAELAKEIEREGARQRIITANEQAAIDNQLAELARVAEQQNPGSDDPLQELVKTVEREDSRQRIIAANIAREAQEKYPDADDPAAELAKEIERDQSRQQIFADRFAREAARQFPDADDPTAERIKKIEQDLKRHVVLQDNQAAAIRASDLEAEQEQVGNDLGDRAIRAANSIAEAHLMYEQRTLPSMEAERTADNARKAEADERAKAMGLGPEFGIGAAKDVGREVLSLGQVETKTFDPGAAIIALEDAGEAVTPENIQRVRDLEASLKELAIATGKSQIPLHDAIVAARAGNYGEAGANVALDVFSFVPIFGQMAKAARAGATAGRVAGIGARGLVPIGNPQGLGRTVKGYRDLVETAVNPNVIPISALESRRTTIRVPLEEYGDITEAQAQQIRDMQARMRIESGQPVAVQRPDGKFLEVRGTATRGQLDGTAFHTTPGGGSFDRPAYIYGQEGGLYTAPDVHMRFGDATSRGQVLPQQSEIIAVRDPDQIQNLQGSDKTFMGNLEQELIIPSGQSIRVDNPASNLRTFDSSVGDIKTGRYGRIEADTDRIPIKTIGGDISLADRMRLKATGARNVFETLNPIGYYDRQRGWRVLDRPSDDAIRLNPADRPPDGTPPRITDDIDDYADDAARRRRVENIQREADGGGYVASGGRELSRSDDEPSIDQRRGVEPVSDEGTAVVRRGVDRVSDEAEALRRAQQRQDEIRRIVGRSQEQRRRDAAERPRRQRSARQPGRQTPERVTRTTPERITRTTPERVTRTTPERITRTTPERVTRTTPERITRTTPERVTRTTPERITRTTPERVTRTTPERATRTTPERITRTTPERVTRTTPERITRTTPERVTRTTPERITRTTPERVTRTTPERITRTTPERVTRTTPERITRTTPERVTRTTPERITRTTPERVTRTTPERITRTTPERVTRTTPERITRTTPERVTRTTPERATRTTPERITRTTPERVTRTTPERITRTTPERVTRTTPERITRTTPERVTRTTPERITRTTPERVTRTTPERITRTTPERVTRTTPERITRTTPERVTRTTPERITRTTPERVTRTTPERITRTTPERVTRTTPERATRTTPERITRTTPERVTR
ncbi:MAG: hypothetical protein OXI71_02115, partial [Gemmatimonadota bacterium]|nr:hypothetical protein [Gemmatimonadota bacterium]